MSHLIGFILIGLLCVVLLLLWALRGRHSASQDHAPEALPVPEFQRPPRMLVDRIFAERDWIFVATKTGPEIQRIFFRERRQIALFWLRHTRRQAATLMKFHRRAVRRNVELKVGLEMRLATNYITFLFLCGILSALIRARGPFRAKKVANYALQVTDELWAISESLLTGVNPARLNEIYTAWTRKPV